MRRPHDPGIQIPQDLSCLLVSGEESEAQVAESIATVRDVLRPSFAERGVDRTEPCCAQLELFRAHAAHNAREQQFGSMAYAYPGSLGECWWACPVAVMCELLATHTP